MKFGAVAPADADGAIAVHSIRQGGLVLRKGTLIGQAEIAALTKAGIAEVVVARLEPGDVSEDEAALTDGVDRDRTLGVARATAPNFMTRPQLPVHAPTTPPGAAAAAP